MKILIVQNRKGIGDMVIFLPYIEAISKKFGTPVSILVKENSKAYQILNENKHINKIINLDRDNKGKEGRHDGIRGSFNLAAELKKYNFDKIFIFNSSLRFYLIAKMSGIKSIYQYPLFEKKNQHIIKAAQIFLKKNLDLDVDSNPKIFVEEAESIKFKKQFNIDNNVLNILLGTGGSGPNKRIPAKIYLDFINMCKDKYNCRFFIATGKNIEEQNIMKEIIKENEKYCTRLDHLTIKETLPVIKNCNLSICNDTSFSHLSAALGVETIVLLADTATLYGNYSLKMHPIVPEKKISSNENLLPKEKISSIKIFEKFENILPISNFLK